MPILSRCLLLAFLSLSQMSMATAAKPDATVPAPTRSGFFDVWSDADKGRVLLGIRDWNSPFLLVSSLPHGLGSNDVGLDRGQPGNVRMVEFRRVGPRVLLVERNTRYIADSMDAAERVGAEEAFAESVLWSGEVVDRLPGGAVRVDFSTFLAGDRHGIADRIKENEQGEYSIDAARSVALLDAVESFPDNTELEALLTFEGKGEGEYVRQVSMDPKSLSLRQHLSLVRLPRPGYRPRAYHPASGGFSQGVIDFAQPLAASLDVRYQPRFRLEKTDPAAAVSTVKKPIVFYLDPGTPEPVRSALLDGANWWKTAFEKAGYRDAFRAELLPPGADPMDIRYNTILWVHRATRGWSYGAALMDPRNGEIIKGAVTLGSQRVRQDILIAESLLAPYANGDHSAAAAAAQAMALARLRQLAAHEVGHALGFAHNFAASREGNGSVMDYPHPLLQPDADGGLRLQDAYGVGVGPWDDFIVKHAYAEFAPGTEAAALKALRDAAAAVGLQYISDADARAPGDAHPDGLLWDYGPNTLQTFDRLLAVRRNALRHFDVGVLPPARQLGELEARLVPVYLLHRYQTEAVARLLGGARYRYGLAGDTTPGSAPVAAAEQRAALAALLRLLDADELRLPDSVLDALTPPANDYQRTREYFTTAMTPLFDPLAAAAAATAVPLAFLFDPQRLNRIAWQHARDAQQPGIDAVLDGVFRSSWRHAGDGDGVASTVQLAANWVVLDALLATLDGGTLHPQVDAEVRAHLRDWQRWLATKGRGGAVDDSRALAAQRIQNYLADPTSVKLRPLPVVPPGAPI